MSDDPFLTLIVEALNLMHPRFAAAHGREYPDYEVLGPDTGPSRRKDRERSFLMEFYHQFRHLWDQALPVRLGLGHVVVQGEPEPETLEDMIEGRPPDLLFWQLAEHGQPARRLACVSVVFASNPNALAEDLQMLSTFRRHRGYPQAVGVIVGRVADLPDTGGPSAEGVPIAFFDTDRWQALSVA